MVWEERKLVSYFLGPISTGGVFMGEVLASSNFSVSFLFGLCRVSPNLYVRYIFRSVNSEHFGNRKATDDYCTRADGRSARKRTGFCYHHQLPWTVYLFFPFASDQIQFFSYKCLRSHFTAAFLLLVYGTVARSLDLFAFIA